MFLVQVYIAGATYYVSHNIIAGHLPLVPRNRTFYVTYYSPGTKIHRVMMGLILFSMGVILAIGSATVAFYVPDFIGWLGLSGIGLMLFVVGLWIGVQGARIPDLPPNSPLTSSAS